MMEFPRHTAFNFVSWSVASFLTTDILTIVDCLFCPTQVKLSKCCTSSEIRISRSGWSCNAMVIVADLTEVKAKFMSTGAQFKKRGSSFPLMKMVPLDGE